MNNNKFNICIIGAGVVGLAIAERLSKDYDNIIVIEKESSFGMHVSSRNSEVIHSGFYYPSDSLKAKLCVLGNKMIYEFCKKYRINFKKCGKLIATNDKNDKKKLLKLQRQAIANSIDNVQILSYEESKSIEPRIKCVSSLWIPSSGIIDSHGLMSKLENISVSQGVDIAYNTKLESINKIADKYELKFNKNEIIYSDIVINSAGLWSQNISEMLDIDKYELEYYKGDYYKSKTIKNLNCLIYPIPTVLSLGIHTVLSLNGDVSFGPNVYKVNSIDYKITDKYKKIYFDEINKYIHISQNDIYPDFSGIRPKIKYNGTFNDFMINNEIKKGFKNFINLVGIDSPGLTASLAIADYISSLIIK